MYDTQHYTAFGKRVVRALQPQRQPVQELRIARRLQLTADRAFDGERSDGLQSVDAGRILALRLRSSDYSPCVAYIVPELRSIAERDGGGSLHSILFGASALTQDSFFPSRVARPDFEF